MSDINNVDDQTWRDEDGPEPDESGVVTECAGCNTTMLLHLEEDSICPLCAWEGYKWTKAYLVRRDDIIRMGGVNHMVTAEEDFGKRVCIYAGDTMWMRHKLDKVLVREEG